MSFEVPLFRIVAFALAPLALAACSNQPQLPPASYSMGPITPSEAYTKGQPSSTPRTFADAANPYDSCSALTIDVYDGVTGLGGVLNNSLAGLSNDFQAVRDPVTGDFGGLVTGMDGAGGIGNIGSVRSAAFRGRGVRGAYQRQFGQLTAALAAGYDRRTFIAAAGTILEAADGLTDEIIYINAGLTRELGRSANLTANGYVSWFQTGFETGDITAGGASLAYNRFLTPRLVGRAALGVDYIDSAFADEDFAFFDALLGLRYNF
ncbi:MAG: hypothetical protein ACXIT4_08830 [Erythrobacter sp.]